MSSQELDLAFKAFLQEKGDLDFRSVKLKGVRPVPMARGSVVMPEIETKPLDLRKEMDDQFIEWAELFRGEEFPGRPKRDNRLVYTDAGDREPEFQSWYSKWAKEAGLDPDPNPDLHKYDYRKAFLAGEEPKPDPKTGDYHWDSRFKYRQELEGEDHPNRYVNGVDTAPLGLWEKAIADQNYVEKGPSRQPSIGMRKGPPMPESLVAEEKMAQFKNKSRNYVRQLGDFYKYAYENPLVALPGRLAVFMNDAVKAVTMNNVDILAASNWVYDKLGLPLAWTADDEAAFMRQKMGYVPEKFLTGQKLVANATMLIPYSALLRGVHAGMVGLLPATKAAPIVQSVASNVVAGTVSGLLRKPEGKGIDDFKARMDQIPGDVAFFTLMGLGVLGAEQMSRIMSWEKAYGQTFRELGGQMATEISPVAMRAPAGAATGRRVEFTPQQVKALWQKMNANAGGTNVALTAEEKAAIEALNSQKIASEILAKPWPPPTAPRGDIPTALKTTESPWTAALPGKGRPGEGFVLEPAGVYPGWQKTPVGFPRQPEMSDLFKVQYKATFQPIAREPGAPPVEGDARTVPGMKPTLPEFEPSPVPLPPSYRTRAQGVVGAQPSAPPMTGEIGTGPQYPIAPTGAPPPPPPPPAVPAPPAAAPVTPTPAAPLGLPPSPLGQRAPMNQELRQVVDQALAGLKGEAVPPEALSKAREMLSNETKPNLGSGVLADIQERNKVWSYYAALDARVTPEMEKQLGPMGAEMNIRSQVATALTAMNTDPNPLSWPASREGTGLFFIGAKTPADLEQAIDGLRLDLGDIKLDVGFGASIEEAESRFIPLSRAPGVAPGAAPAPTPTPQAQDKEPIFHFTHSANIGKIFDQGFNTKLPGLFGYGAVPKPVGAGGYGVASKPARGVLYFTRDLQRYGVADVPAGEGKGLKDYRYYDREKRSWVTLSKFLQPTEMGRIEAFIKPSAKILTLDSAEKYLEYVRSSGKQLRDSLKHVVNKAKQEGWDILRVHHAPGKWEIPGYDIPGTGETDLYYWAIGAGGEDDFFVFNRKAITIPEERTHHARKVSRSRALAARKRGRVGWPKGDTVPKLWRDIFDITGGQGMKPQISETTGLVSSEFKETVPPFMWNPASPHTIASVRAALAGEGETTTDVSGARAGGLYNYSFDNEDIFSLLGDAWNKWRFEGGVDPVAEETLSHATPEQMQADYDEGVGRLQKPGEDYDDFMVRMREEASASGFGDDVDEYIATEIDLSKKKALADVPGTPEGGEEPPEYFSLEKAGLTKRDLGDHLEQDLPRGVIFDLRHPDTSHWPEYVSYVVPEARVWDDGLRKELDSKMVEEGAWADSVESPELSYGGIDRVMDWLNQLVWKSRADYFLAHDYFWSDKSPIDKVIVGQQIKDGAKPEDGPDYKPTLPSPERKAGEKRRGGYGVDKVRAWFNEGKLKYPNTAYIGDVSIREWLQNSIDAAIEALEKGEIKSGVLTLKYYDNYFYGTDNGVGMSDDDIADRFLMLHATGKSKIGRFGGMGIAKAVILAPSETARWTLHTRGNWFTHEMANREDIIGTRPKIQGTRIYVRAAEDIISEKAELYVKTTKLPPGVSVVLERGSGVGGKKKGSRVVLEEGYDIFEGMSGETSHHIEKGNKLELTYYSVVELEKKGLLDLLNKKVIARIVDEKTGSKLAQFIRGEWGKFEGVLVADISSPHAAGTESYPFTDSRMALKYDFDKHIDNLKERFITDKATAMRAGLAAPSIKALGEVSPKWGKIVVELPNNFDMKRLERVIRQIYTETKYYNHRSNTTDPFLPLHKYKAAIDQGYNESLCESEYNALCAIGYDAMLRLISGVMHNNYHTPEFLFSVDVGGTRVVSSWMAGRVRYNPASFADKTAGKSPMHLADMLFDLATHESGHYLYPHGEEFDMYVDRIRQDMQDYKRYFLDVAEAVHGKLETARFKVMPWAQAQLPSRETLKRVRKRALDKLGSGQLDLISKTEETHEPRNIYEPGPTGGGEGGREEGLLTRRPDRQHPRLPGQKGDVEAGRGAQLPGAPGDAGPQPAGVGIREGGPGEPQEHFFLKKRPPAGPRLPMDMPGMPAPKYGGPQEVAAPREVELEDTGLTAPQPKPERLKPAEPYAPREGERAPQGILPMADASPLTAGTEPAPVLDPKEIFDAVNKFTRPPYYPRSWSRNTWSEAEDNRQNMIMHILRNYRPSDGPLENYINNIKGHFTKGEVPSGSKSITSKEGGAIKRPGSLTPEATPGSGAIEPMATSALEGDASQPKHKPPAELQTDADEIALEAQKRVEDEAVAKVLRDVAREVAQAKAGAAGQESLFGVESGSKLEDAYFDILASRLIDIPEPYHLIAARTGLSVSEIERVFNKMLMPALQSSPGAKEMLTRHVQNRFVQLNMALGPPLTERELKKILDELWRWTSRSRGVSKATDRQNDIRVAYPMAQRFLAVKDAYDLKKWQNNQPRSTDEMILDLLTGRSARTNGYDAVLNSPDLPPNIKDILLRMRSRMDMLSNLLMLEGAAPHSVNVYIAANLGVYIERKFRLYESKKWLPNDAKRAGMKRLLMNPAPLSGLLPMSSAEADAYLDEVIDFARTVKKRGGLKAAGLEIPQDSFIHRLDLSPEWKEFAGEILDPKWLYIDTVTRQAVDAANAQMLNWLADTYGEYTLQNKAGIWTKDSDLAKIHEKPDGGYESWENNYLPDKQAFGRLRGSWVSKDLHRYIMREFLPSIDAWEKWVQRLIIHPYKLSKTVLNIPTHARNTFGNTYLAMLQGTSLHNPFNWKYYKKSLWAHLNRTGSSSDEWAKLIRTGFTETGYYGTEIPRIVDSIMNLDDPGWIYKLYDKVVKLPIDKLLQWYNFEDSLFRVAAYYHNIEKGMSAEDSLEDINMSFPNYRKLPLAVEFLRRVPLLGPWISFKANMAVIVAARSARGAQDMNTPGKRWRGIWGLTKLGMLIFSTTILSELSKRFQDIDEEDIKELEKYMQPWHKHGSLIYFRGRDGKLKALDINYVNPMGEFERGFKALLAGDFDTLKETTDFLSMPLADIVQMLAYQRDPKWGTEYGGFWKTLEAVLAYIYLPGSSPIPSIRGLREGKFAPGIEYYINPKTGKEEIRVAKKGGGLRKGTLTGTAVRAIYDAYNRNPNEYLKIRNLPEEIKNFLTGLRSFTVHPDDVLLRALKSRDIEIDQIDSRYSRWKTRNLAVPKAEDDRMRAVATEKILKLQKEQGAIALLIQKLSRDQYRVRRKH